MQKHTYTRFVHSLILIPMFATGASGATVGVMAPKPSLSDTLIATLQFNNNTEVVDTTPLPPDTRGEKIDAYFKARKLPLAGYGDKLVAEADKNNLDWTLVAAIAMRESTGGEQACQRVENNYWGWGSCRIGFKSLDEAIEKISAHLAGNNPNTAQHYAGKDVKAILQKYNPPSIVPKYADQVMAIMKSIADIEIPADSQEVIVAINK